MLKITDTAAHRYSKEQKDAIEIFDRNVCVFAGAGSGKTTVLVERFLHAAVKRKIEPERILALTFTEKAANEMKSRLVRECDKRGLGDFRRRLENSYISTIHGFCARLLKENPIEGGVDPYFQILGEGESEIIMDKVMDELLEEEAGNEPWLRILADFGEEEIRAVFKKFYAWSRAEAGDPSVFQYSDGRAARVERERRLTGAVEEIPEPKLKAAASTIRGLLKNQKQMTWELVQSVSEACEGVHRRGRHKEFIDQMLGLVGEWISSAVEELAAPVKKEFLRVFARFKDRYEGEKRRRASYDFEDLLYLAYQLLSSEAVEKKAVCSRYRDFFAAILVDEYQDTSPLQARIIELLKKEDNLFVVGDIQQSIYGFRYATPAVFKKFSEGAVGSVQKIVLRDNYRSRKEILSFVNHLFQAIPTDNAFEGLRPKREFPSEKPHSVELLCVSRDKEKGLNLDQARVIEARTLAGRIKEWHDSKSFEYRDIAILLRNTTSSHLYEKELTDLLIPYTVWKGRGFYEQQEIADLVNTLKLIENPSLDIPLAGVLRSPLVQVSEDALFWLAFHAKKEDKDAPLSGALQILDRIVELSAADRERLFEFKGLLEQLRAAKDRLKVSETLKKILVATQYEAKMLTRPQGRQKVANVRKLAQIARLLEERQLFGIEDFTRYLKNMSEREVTEPQARTQGEGGNVVTIATVHAAKGLEFPCVIIADMGSEGRRNKRGNFLSSKEAGLGVKLRNPFTGSFVPDAAFCRIEEMLSEKEAKEDGRLFYVGMTRAKEHLVLSGSVGAAFVAKEDGRHLNWMERVSRIINFHPEATDKEALDFHGITVKLIKPRSEGGAPLTKGDARRLGWEWDEDFFKRLQIRLQRSEKEYEGAEDRTVTELLLASTEGALQKEALAEEAPIPTPRNEYGTVFHQWMEFLVSHRSQKGAGNRMAARFTAVLNESERVQMKESVLKFWASPLGKEIAKAKKCYPELPFIYKTKHGILKGQMDLVFQTNRGEWVVLDYKTNRIASNEKEALAREYEFQLGLYALIFKELYGEIPKRGVLYFAAIHEPFGFSYQEEDFGKFQERLDFWMRFCNNTLTGGTPNGKDRNTRSEKRIQPANEYHH